MANYALLNKYNIVVNVVGGPDENEETDWEKEISDITGLVCKRTSCKRSRYAGCRSTSKRSKCATGESCSNTRCCGSC